MNEQDNKPSLEHGVMDAIRSGRVRMRPRWKFILSGVLAGLGIVILVCTLLFIVSFSIFTLRETGVLFTPIFGMRGLFTFFSELPFILIVLLVLFMIVLEVLVRRYRVGYRMPLLLSVVAILVIVLIGGYAVERTHVHEMLLRQARMPNGGLPPPIANMYRAGAQHVPGVFHGTIVSVTSYGFLLVDSNVGGTTTVFVSPSTISPPEKSFKPGEEVVVFGNEASGTVHAVGVVQISD